MDKGVFLRNKCMIFCRFKKGISNSRGINSKGINYRKRLITYVSKLKQYFSFKQHDLRWDLKKLSFN